MKIVTFATTDPHYSGFADRFAARMKELGLDHRVDRFAPFPSPRMACLTVPAYVEKMLDLHGPVLWVDVDTDVVAPIEIDLADHDVGFAENPAKWLKQNPNNTVAAAVVAWNDTPRARVVLAAWRRQCEAWREGEFGAHRRLCFVREMEDFRELDITPMLRDRVIYRGAKGREEMPA